MIKTPQNNIFMISFRNVSVMFPEMFLKHPYNMIVLAGTLTHNPRPTSPSTNNPSTHNPLDPQQQQNIFHPIRW